MSVKAVKQHLQAVMLQVPDVGTLDLSPLDTDKPPQQLRGTTPYWYVTVRGLTRAPEGLIEDSSRQQSFARTYACRLEGWRGITGTAEAWDDWEVLTEAIADRLLLDQPRGQRYGVALRSVSNIAVALETVTVQRDGSTGYRAHHALITADVMVWMVLAR